MKFNRGREFSYLNEMGAKRGVIQLNEDSVVTILNPSQADNKRFPFSLCCGNEV